MADTKIFLEIQNSKSIPAPVDEYDLIPWRIAMVSRARASNPNRRHGNRPKKKGYYYRFSGGNSKWDDGTDIDDGDFEFPATNHTDSSRIRTIDIEFHANTHGWKFIDVKDIEKNSPLTWSISGGNVVNMSDDTANTELTSGSFGVQVVKGSVELYCDPDWDNR